MCRCEGACAEVPSATAQARQRRRRCCRRRRRRARRRSICARRPARGVPCRSARALRERSRCDSQRRVASRGGFGGVLFARGRDAAPGALRREVQASRRLARCAARRARSADRRVWRLAFWEAHGELPELLAVRSTSQHVGEAAGAALERPPPAPRACRAALSALGNAGDLVQPLRPVAADRAASLRQLMAADAAAVDDDSTRSTRTVLAPVRRGEPPRSPQLRNAREMWSGRLGGVAVRRRPLASPSTPRTTRTSTTSARRRQPLVRAGSCRLPHGGGEQEEATERARRGRWPKAAAAAGRARRSHARRAHLGDGAREEGPPLRRIADLLARSRAIFGRERAPRRRAVDGVWRRRPEERAAVVEHRTETAIVKRIAAAAVASRPSAPRRS